MYLKLKWGYFNNEFPRIYLVKVHVKHLYQSLSQTYYLFDIMMSSLQCQCVEHENNSRTSTAQTNIYVHIQSQKYTIICVGFLCLSNVSNFHSFRLVSLPSKRKKEVTRWRTPLTILLMLNKSPSQHSITPHFYAEMYVPGGIAGSQQVYKNNLL